ncbi:MAG TPA: response regulator, partial [Dissulfuribacter thermophilus]|nr:response regulator [Dissulfuribacter thermophilus]
ILVTEDDPIVLETVSSLLESLGYKVFRAKDAQEAIEIAKLYAGTIQLLFTDVVLPEMNGKELYERIKEEIPGIKVLFTSGYTENIIARHGVLEHGVSFIQKPYELSTLAKVIREVLDGVVIS